jgi:hypothetical protein
MRRPATALALALSVSTLLAACSPPARDRAEDSLPAPTDAPSAEETGGSGTPTAGPGATPGAGSTAGPRPGTSATRGVSGSGQAGKNRVPSKAAPPKGATSVDPGVPNGGFTYKGVTNKEITVAFHWNRNDCGADINSRLTNFSSNEELSINTYVEYVNRHANDGTLMDGYPINLHGRRLKAVFVSSGGADPTCAAQNRAAALQITDEVKAFAAVAGTLSFDEDQVAPLVARGESMHFGSAFFSEEDFYSKGDPFIWSLYGTGTIMVRHLADYMTQRLVKVNPPGHDRFAPAARVYGLLHQDTPAANRIAEEFKGFLAGRVQIASEFAYTPDFSRAQAESNAALARFRAAGVNTIVMLTDPVAPIFFTKVAQEQGYSPDYLVSSFGYQDIATAVGNYEPRQARNFFGVSDFGPESQGSKTEQNTTRPYAKAFREINPNGSIPDDAVAWYATLSSLVWGISAAGPNLTPQTVKAGLVNKVRAFRPTNYLVDFLPGRHGAIDDYALVSYNPAAQDPRDSPSSTSGQRRGKYIFYECSKPISGNNQCAGTPRRYRTGQRL